MSDLHMQLDQATKALHDCLDLWVQMDKVLTKMEKELKYFPGAANLKKSLEKK